MIPAWLELTGEISLAIAGLCAALIVMDLFRGNRQQMWIMNVVWPVTALWSGPFGFWAYLRYGRLSSQRTVQEAKQRGQIPPAKRRPFRVAVGIASTHCGAGCSLGDLAAEWIHSAAPFTIAGVATFGAWTLDYILAFAFGIAFQFFTIAPMRNLSLGQGLVQALKADTLSLTAWQIGMYGWMAVMRFAVFGQEIPKTAAFWFLMQIAMAAGFLTSYPVNWWLLKKGIKEKM